VHPILAQRRRLVVYLVAWLPVAAIVASLLVLTGWGGWVHSSLFALTLATVYAFLCLAAWYPCRAFPLKDRAAVVALGTHLATAAVSAVVWLMLAVLVARGFARFGEPTQARLSAGQAGYLLAMGVLLYVLSVAIHYLFVAAEESRAAERRALEAEVAARDAELLVLKTQLNPHFLFNSLNSVASLAATDPKAARDMCVELGDYLRFTLTRGADALHPLREELQQIRRYLAVEKVRFGDRLSLREQVDENCLDLLVPPLLLQPLVENALKHGIAELIHGGVVDVGARCGGSRLRLWVGNPVDPASRARPGEGVGLDNVRRRLEKAFGGEARLKREADETSFRVEIALPAFSASASRNEMEQTRERH
jgi:signal transduction histidine kinase